MTIELTKEEARVLTGLLNQSAAESNQLSYEDISCSGELLTEYVMAKRILAKMKKAAKNEESHAIIDTTAEKR